METLYHFAGAFGFALVVLTLAYQAIAADAKHLDPRPVRTLYIVHYTHCGNKKRWPVQAGSAAEALAYVKGSLPRSDYRTFNSVRDVKGRFAA